MPIVVPVMTTLDSHYYLLCGQSPTLPIDPIFRITEACFFHEISSLCQRMEKSYERGLRISSKLNRYRLSRMKGKRQYKRKDKSPVLRPGDRVSKKYTRKRRTWKIVILLGGGNLWSNQAESRKKPIYEVEPESGEGLRSVVHSSPLLSCNEFSFQRKTEDPARRPTQKRKITRPAVLSTPSPASETSSDEEA